MSSPCLPVYGQAVLFEPDTKCEDTASEKTPMQWLGKGERQVWGSYAHLFHLIDKRVEFRTGFELARLADDAR